MPPDPDPLATRLAARDLTLFDSVSSQSTTGDRRAWLAVQAAVRQREGGYVYLEIGSHLGGSIQQHIVDPRCRQIFSIDKRPLEQPDDSRGACYYEGNSTERMLENLRRLAPDALERVVTFDADSREIVPEKITAPPDFCFIDGEHTKEAVLADFAFCRRVAKPDAAICFHDAGIIWPAIRHIAAELRAEGVPFLARKFDGLTFAILLGDGPAACDAAVQRMGEDGEAFLRRKHLHQIAVGWIPVSIRKTLGGLLKKGR